MRWSLVSGTLVVVFNNDQFSLPVPRLAHLMALLLIRVSLPGSRSHSRRPLPYLVGSHQVYLLLIYGSHTGWANLVLTQCWLVLQGEYLPIANFELQFQIQFCKTSTPRVLLLLCYNFPPIPLHTTLYFTHNNSAFSHSISIQLIFLSKFTQTQLLFLIINGKTVKFFIQYRLLVKISTGR